METMIEIQYVELQETEKETATETAPANFRYPPKPEWDGRGKEPAWIYNLDGEWVDANKFQSPKRRRFSWKPSVKRAPRTRGKLDTSNTPSLAILD